MAGIKISDLSIGDWVKVDDFDKVLIQRVVAIDATRREIGIIKNNRGGIYWYYEDEIEPIPLTPEILEKNGFVDYEVGKGWYVLNVADDLRVWLHRNSHDWTFQLMKWSPLSTHEIGKVFINHTHQLQHALRLAGVEKEIEL
jgi:hypothetical protein